MQDKYTTIQGDTWSTIAYKTLGSGKYIVELINANLKLREVYSFGAGVEITIPTVSAGQPVELPPWRDA